MKVLCRDGADCGVANSHRHVAMNAAVEYAEFAETIACRQDSIEVEPSPKSARRYSMEFRLVFEPPPRSGKFGRQGAASSSEMDAWLMPSLCVTLQGFSRRYLQAPKIARIASPVSVYARAALRFLTGDSGSDEQVCFFPTAA
jgi:hypothetical protein